MQNDPIWLRSADNMFTLLTSDLSEPSPTDDTEEHVPSNGDAGVDSHPVAPSSPLSAIQSVQNWGLAIAGQLQAAITDISAADTNVTQSTL